MANLTKIKKKLKELKSHLWTKQWYSDTNKKTSLRAINTVLYKDGNVNIEYAKVYNRLERIQTIV
jgi:hypothetical protein